MKLAPPKTAERAPAINAELQYRLDFLRVCDRAVTNIEKAQQHLETSAWSRAAKWIHEVLLFKAAESIDELRPVEDGFAARDRAVADFVRSLEER